MSSFSDIKKRYNLINKNRLFNYNSYINSILVDLITLVFSSLKTDYFRKQIESIDLNEIKNWQDFDNVYFYLWNAKNNENEYNDVDEDFKNMEEIENHLEQEDLEKVYEFFCDGQQFLSEL